VDPAFNATLDAYGYSDENPLDATDPSGLMLSAGGAGICNTAAACDATKSACSPQSERLPWNRLSDNFKRQRRRPR